MKRLITLITTLCMIFCFSAVALADGGAITVTYQDKTYTGTLRECQEQAQADFGGCVCGYLYLEGTGKLYNINIHEEERQYYLDGTGEDIDATPEPTTEPTMEPTPTPTLTPLPTPTPTPVTQQTTQPTTARPVPTINVIASVHETINPTSKPDNTSSSPTPKPCGCSIEPVLTPVSTIVPAATTKAIMTTEPTTSPGAKVLAAEVSDPTQEPCPCILRQKITEFFIAIGTWFLNLIA